MIPLKLNLKNFMCYRDNVPTLDMESFRVACLCGDNGHGKTALLDAMTWALWGKARARSQELVHQGQQDMVVELEFLAREQRHRVSRRYSLSRSGQGNTILEHHVASANGFREVTGNSLRDTEVQISELLHMDYETFVNTAFLLQGQADRFTTSTPAKRKELLAEVLDLSYYQAMEERAKDRARVAQDAMRDADNAIALRREEAGRKPEDEAALATVAAELGRLGQAVAAQRAKVDELGDSIGSLRGLQHEQEAVTGRLTASRSAVAELERRVEDLQASVSGYESSLTREAEIRAGFVDLEAARAELDRLDKVSFRFSQLNQEMATLKQSIAVEREGLSQKLKQQRTYIATELEPRAKRVPELEAGLSAIASDKGQIEDVARSVQGQRDAVQEASARLQYLEDANAKLKGEMEETRKKFDLLEQEDALCPVCRQPLGTEGQSHLRSEYAAAGRDAKQRYQEQHEEGEKLRVTQSALTAEIARRQSDLERQRHQFQAALAANERDLEECRQAREKLQPALSEVEQLQTALDRGEFAVEEQQRLREMEGEAEGLGYDPETHRVTQQRVKSLEPFADLNRRLIEAAEALPKTASELDNGRNKLRGLAGEIDRDEARRMELSRLLDGLPSLEVEVASAGKLQAELDGQHRAADVRRGVLTDRLARHAKLENERRELEGARHKSADEKGVYDELAVAFGKNGIQALIIETAIPQLQNDANELLGRLTDYRMSLKLQLQEGRKERRMGLPSEELDVKISDEAGTRSYETFSGGEAFRINFALRIALSKLLARRAGAPLPILFIDEGFGSQDSSGQERLKEAIQSIHSEFQKIIVITHIEQIKDSFPTRIEVSKEGLGSTFVVV